MEMGGTYFCAICRWVVFNVHLFPLLLEMSEQEKTGAEPGLSLF